MLQTSKSPRERRKHASLKIRFSHWSRLTPRIDATPEKRRAEKKHPGRATSKTFDLGDARKSPRSPPHHHQYKHAEGEEDQANFKLSSILIFLPTRLFHQLPSPRGRKFNRINKMASCYYALHLAFFFLCWASWAALGTARPLTNDYYFYQESRGYYFSTGSRSISENKDRGFNNYFGPHSMRDFHSPWASFFNFSDCRFGESQQGLRQMKQYLANFGYLPSSPSFGDSFDESFRAAILAYQHFFHLNATGALDPSTLEKMVEPRCGVSDVNNKSSSPSSSSLHGRNLYSFFNGTPIWPKTKSTLTYGFESTSAVSIDTDVLKTVFSRAFGRWAEVTTLTFSEVDPNFETPDLRIGFFQGPHGDGEPFDGQLGTLAHAFSPTDGRFHLDATEAWVASAEDKASENLLQLEMAVDLESVAVHEIGHLLGLGHSEVEEAIMYPTIKTRTRRVKLAQDDILGIQKLYGSNPSYNGSSAYVGGSTTSPTAQGGRESGGASSSLPTSLAFFLSPLLLLLFQLL